MIHPPQVLPLPGMAGTGENLFNGEYLINAQGEDVVACVRTPHQITKVGSQRWAKLAHVSEEEKEEELSIIGRGHAFTIH